MPRAKIAPNTSDSAIDALAFGLGEIVDRVGESIKTKLPPFAKGPESSVVDLPARAFSSAIDTVTGAFRPKKEITSGDLENAMMDLVGPLPIIAGSWGGRAAIVRSERKLGEDLKEFSNRESFDPFAKALDYVKNKAKRVFDIPETIKSVAKEIPSHSGPAVGAYRPSTKDILVARSSKGSPRKTHEIVRTLAHEAEHAVRYYRDPDTAYGYGIVEGVATSEEKKAKAFANSVVDKYANERSKVDAIFKRPDIETHAQEKYMATNGEEKEFWNEVLLYLNDTPRKRQRIESKSKHLFEDKRRLITKSVAYDLIKRREALGDEFIPDVTEQSLAKWTGKDFK